jgi:hypothetical protein
MPSWVKNDDGRMVEVETADERDAREKSVKDSILLQLSPMAEWLLQNPEDEEAYRAIMAQFSTPDDVQRLIDSELIDGSGDATNFTFLPNELVVKTIGSSGNFRICDMQVLTAEKAQAEMDELACIQAAMFNSKDGSLRCSRCGTVIDPYQDCPKCGKTWKYWLEEKLEPLLKERQQRKLAEIVATGDTSKMCFDLSESECA